MPIEFIGMIGVRPEGADGAAVHVIGGEIDRGWVRDFSRVHEEAGFDKVLVGYTSTAAEGFVVSSYAAAHTERLAFLIAHRPGFVAPTLAARKAATLDQFTGGRVALHIITGGSDADQAKDGDWLDHDTRYRRTDEYLAVMRRTWTEDRPFDHILSGAIPTALGTSLLGASVGLLGTDLARRSPTSLILTVPLLVGVVLNNRHAAAQRDEHLRVERLYEATAATAGLGSPLEAMATVAEQARTLITGTTAICCVKSDLGWEGMYADADGARPAETAWVELVVDRARDLAAGHDDASVPEALRAVVRPSTKMVAVRSPQHAPLQLVLAVFRRADQSDGRRGQRKTLTAFAAHGALMIANARSHEAIGQSLEQQVLANRHKDEFIAAVSHELRTPLTVMHGAVQTMLRLDLSADDRTHFLQMADGQADRLRRLIEDLLLVAAVQQGAPVCNIVPCDIPDFVDHVLADLREATRTRLRVDREQAFGSLLSDEFRLSQIVVNLIENADKYAPAGTIDVVFRNDGLRLSIRVRDHGPGIRADDHERAFDRFVQLDGSSTRAHGGTGLGLFLCRQLADQLSGRVVLEDTPGGGCTFTVSIPLVSPTAEAGAGTQTEQRRAPMRCRPATMAATAATKEGAF